MAVDPRKRQKKLEKQKAKKKAARRELARRESGGMPVQLKRAAAAPILHCCYNAKTWENGMGQVLISRQLPRDNVAFVLFLLDTYCLGVKDLMMGVAPRATYDDRLYDDLRRAYGIVQIAPEYARKLVESAVQYARELGFSPHSDYRTASLIFGDIDAAACHEQFTFGKEGKPYFFAGPADDPARCRYIVHTLHDRCGIDGFHFIVPAEAITDELVRALPEDDESSDDRSAAADS